jgi:hypothetical protein
VIERLLDKELGGGIRISELPAGFVP